MPEVNANTDGSGATAYIQQMPGENQQVQTTKTGQQQPLSQDTLEQLNQDTGKLSTSAKKMNQIIQNARDPSNPDIPAPGGGTVVQHQDLESATRKAVLSGGNAQTVLQELGADSTLSLGGNAWLAGNAYVEFVTNFFEMQKMLMQIKALEKRIELQSQDMFMELAQNEATSIVALGEMKMQEHILKAVMIGVATLGACIAAGAGPTGTGAVFGEGIKGLGNMSSELVSAAYAVPEAQLEARKVMLAAYKDIMKQMMESAAQSFQDNSKQIDDLIQRLDTMRAKLQEAFNLRQG